MQIEDYYYTDQAYLRRFRIDFVDPVPFPQVIPWMSRGLFSPVIYRPLFSHLRFATCRTFETPAASTIPLLALDVAYVREIYGDDALALVLPEQNGEEKVIDVLRRPHYYAAIVRSVRQHLAAQHSYEARIRQLIELVHS